MKLWEVAWGFGHKDFGQRKTESTEWGPHGVNVGRSFSVEVFGEVGQREEKGRNGWGPHEE